MTSDSDRYRNDEGGDDGDDDGNDNKCYTSTSSRHYGSGRKFG